MSYTESLTQTYTIADIGKVIDCFAADLDMTSQSTGLLTRDLVKRYASDVKAMAQSGYLLEANIVLMDFTGEVIRAAKYEVSTDAASLTASRPGNNRWPATSGGELSVVVRYTQKWRDLTDSQRETFGRILSMTWTTSSINLSFPALTRSADRNYISNGWGVTKSVFHGFN
jgi:Bacterial HORMA domain family 1